MDKLKIRDEVHRIQNHFILLLKNEKDEFKIFYIQQGLIYLNELKNSLNKELNEA